MSSSSSRAEPPLEPSQPQPPPEDQDSLLGSVHSAPSSPPQSASEESVLLEASHVTSTQGSTASRRQRKRPRSILNGSPSPSASEVDEDFDVPQRLVSTSQSSARRHSNESRPSVASSSSSKRKRNKKKKKRRRSADVSRLQPLQGMSLQKQIQNTHHLSS